MDGPQILSKYPLAARHRLSSSQFGVQPGESPAVLVTGPAVALPAASAWAEADANGFQETPSGLKYKIEKVGTGEKPQRGQKVYVDYTLWLDGFGGKQVDSSGSTFPPRPAFSFAAGTGGVIKGWDEAIMGMQVGEARKLIIPPDLGYGERGAGKVIPPNSKLYFAMDLKSMDPARKMSPEQEKWLAEHPL